VGRAGCALAATAAALLVSGCSASIPGTPSAAGVATPPVEPGSRSGLEADPIADECLLDAFQVGALVGFAVQPPAESTLKRPDGSVGRSCVAGAGAEPVALVNVYRTRAGTPAEYVAAGPKGRPLPGAGEAAAVFDTPAGPTLQVASRAYLVTILVARGTPSDDAWRAAALAALRRLPST
jgi:hypothetical protein